jgi:type IV pilus assembly protein PilM
MNLLPKASGTRPRLACEIAAGGIVAARSPEGALPLSAVARAELSEGAVLPGLKPGNVVDRVATIAAVRRVLEQIGARPNARNADLALIIPDAAVRVLLLDFDALPNKLSEALPIVRFRLKKLVPFDADDAMVSFQVMSTSRSVVRVLAVAIPRDVLSEYESVAREAGFEPGAVLPSTLAALAALEEGEGASLVINAHPTGVTTAIVRAGIVLLHRSIELAEAAPATPASLPAALFEPSSLPFVPVGGEIPNGNARFAVAHEGAALADRLRAEAAVQDEDGLDAAEFGVSGDGLNRGQTGTYAPVAGLGMEASPVGRSPYASSTVSADLYASSHHAVLVAPTSLEVLADPAHVEDLRELAAAAAASEDREPPVHTLTQDAQAEEIARAVSVAVAYFEDSLGAAPRVLLSAGSLGADGLDRMLREQGITEGEGVQVRELVATASLAAEAATRSVPRGWLAGVVGALKS